MGARDSFFNARPDDQVYVVREDADGKSYVQFGDGVTGAKLPSGQGNVSAQYRTGSGANGNLVAGTTPSAATRLTGLDKVLLPGPAVGGAEPEAEDGARVAAPGTHAEPRPSRQSRGLRGRALAVPGVVKARATWAEPEALPVLRLTVLTASESQADADKVAETLRALDRAKGPRRLRVGRDPGRAEVRADRAHGRDDPRRIESDMRTAILEALGVSGEEANGIAGDHGLFSLAERQFGQSAHSSQIMAAVQQVTGVSWVTLTCAQPVIELSPRRFSSSRTPAAVSLLPKPKLKLQVFKPLLPLFTLPLLPKVYKAIPCEDTRVLALDTSICNSTLVARGRFQQGGVMRAQLGDPARIPAEIPARPPSFRFFRQLCGSNGPIKASDAALFSSPFKGEVGRGMGEMHRVPIPTLALPLKGREQSAVSPGPTRKSEGAPFKGGSRNGRGKSPPVPLFSKGGVAAAFASAHITPL